MQKSGDSKLSAAAAEITTLPSIGFLAIGDEVVQGYTQNTNLIDLSDALRSLGARIGCSLAVRDHKESIVRAIEFLEASGCSLIITCGGLGPTHDDMTRFALAEALELPLETSQEAVAMIERSLIRRDRVGLPMQEVQALMPVGAQALENMTGIAPAWLIEHAGRRYLSLPGPPKEFNPYIQDYLIPKIEAWGYSGAERCWQLGCIGISESIIAEFLKDQDLSFEWGIYTAAERKVYIRIFCSDRTKTKRGEAAQALYQKLLGRFTRESLIEVTYI